MCVVNIFSGEFCRGAEVVKGIAESLGCQSMDDGALAARAAETYNLPEGKLSRALFDRPSIFNKVSHEKELAVSRLKLTLADLLQKDGWVYTGYASHLIPRSIPHVLDICLIAETSFRMEMAMQALDLGQKEALSKVYRADEQVVAWMEFLGRRDPWNADLYDILIPMDKTSPEQAVELISAHAANPGLRLTPASQRVAADFLLAARVEESFAARGHNFRDAQVSASEGHVTVRINKKVLMLHRLEEELVRLARRVEGVSEVSVVPGPGFYQADVYRRTDFQLPSKVLLVDDEREFAQTLSERLLLREIGSSVVFDGEEALRVVAEDEPEVMVLDLKMPGLDGTEVLRRIKHQHPAVEVIILTGHGSEKDREMCMQLGAFAYLEKPVDIDQLSETMQQAYDKIKAERG